jgi:hypothetical protein
VAPDDFFDDEWEEPSRTQETAPTRPIGERTSPRRPLPSPEDEPAEPGRGPRRPRRPRRPTRPSTASIPRPSALPNLEVGRLAAVAVGLVVLLVVIVFLARSCGGSSTEAKNQDYVDAVRAALKPSDDSSRQLVSLFESHRPLKAVQARRQVAGALASERQALDKAQQIVPTKQAKPYHANLLMALSYRINGLECMNKAVGPAYRDRNRQAAGALLVPCTQRLLASDVVYADSYAAAVNNAFADAGVETRIPTSVYLPPKLHGTVTPEGMSFIIQRWKPGSARSGLHGMSIDSVIAQNDGKNVTLRPGGEVNQVKATTSLVFVVSALNGGNFQEFDIPVTVRLGSGNNAPKATKTIAQVGPGQTATVEITGLTADSSNIPFDHNLNLTVIVGSVPGEHNTSNNRATYTIAFTLAQ